MIRAARIRRRMRELLSNHSIMAHLRLQQSSFSKCVILTLLLCSLIPLSDSVSVLDSNSRNRNRNNNINRNNNNRHVRSHVSNSGPYHHHYHFLDQHNEYDSSSSGVSILDDDTLRLSLAIDDDPNVASAAVRLNAAAITPNIEPKVHLRVSGESGMIKPGEQYHRLIRFQNEVPHTPRASLTKGGRVEAHTLDLSHGAEEDDHDTEGEDLDEEMSDNYHHHFPYIESYREKYTRPEMYFMTTTTPSPPPSTTKKQDGHQVWSNIIAQVTTPSSFNEINSSASEHRLADFHLRANLPSYFYNKYSTYSEEELENVADLDDTHSKYFVKTKPRSVTTAGSNIYSNFYYEPPSFSTKSIQIPVKTNKEKFLFASAKPTQAPQELFTEQDEIDHHHVQQHDTTVMTTMSSNFSNVPTMTPLDDKEGPDDQHNSNSGAPSSAVGFEHADSDDDGYYRSQPNQNHNNNKPEALLVDVSTSQSILSKVTVNNPHDDNSDDDSEAKSLTTPGNNDNQVTSTTEATTTTTDATSIPGVPGIDYPILGEIPQTGFDCKNQRYKGFFADIDSKCQAWHYCDFTDGHSTFLCPNGTLFSQVLLTCDWWFNVDCNQATQLYVLNERLYRYIKPPKPSFPEDFIGEHVDKWLLQQLQMGLLPKVRKRGKAKLVTLPPPKQSTTTSMPPLETSTQHPKN